MRGLIRRAAVAAVAYLGCCCPPADDLGPVPVPGPVPGGPHPVKRPAQHPWRTVHGAGLALSRPARPGRSGNDQRRAGLITARRRKKRANSATHMKGEDMKSFTLRAVLTGVVVMASVLFASPAWATFPGATGRIAFSAVPPPVAPGMT